MKCRLGLLSNFNCTCVWEDRTDNDHKVSAKISMTIPGVGGEGYNSSNNANLYKNANLRPKHYLKSSVY